MPNIAALLKTEIARISRKEIRADTERLQAIVAQQRKELRTSRKEPQPGEPSTSMASADTGVKFSAAKLVKHRRLLGISANEYGSLVGASGQSVYKWEAGKAYPRSKQLMQLNKVLAIGKREFIAQQAALNA
jgi:DNA-binding transcriptional regulator YiaG